MGRKTFRWEKNRKTQIKKDKIKPREGKVDSRDIGLSFTSLTYARQKHIHSDSVLAKVTLCCFSYKVMQGTQTCNRTAQAKQNI